MKQYGAALLVAAAAGAWQAPRAGVAEPAAAENAPSAALPAADPATGRKLFGQNCSRCHGFNMMNPAPGVFDLRTFPLDDKARFLASVSNGKGGMPAWKEVLSHDDIENLWTYIRESHQP